MDGNITAGGILNPSFSLSHSGVLRFKPRLLLTLYPYDGRENDRRSVAKAVRKVSDARERSCKPSHV